MRRLGASRCLAIFVGLAALLPACGCGDDAPRPAATSAPAAGTSAEGSTPAATSPAATPSGTGITVTSSAFSDGGAIPAQYSCARNVSPPLAWAGLPSGAVTLALVLDDPDAVGGRYIHWVVTDIPPSTAASAEGAAPTGGLVGANSGGDRRYLGPCPPAGTGVHHYRFTVYALPKRMELDESTPADQAADAISTAATAQGRLVGTYSG